MPHSGMREEIRAGIICCLRLFVAPAVFRRTQFSHVFMLMYVFHIKELISIFCTYFQMLKNAYFHQSKLSHVTFIN